MQESVVQRWFVKAPLAAKVPEITALFWVIKVLTTGMGEAASDSLAATNRVLAGLVGILLLAVGLSVQLRARRYRAVPYWTAVAAVAVFGTILADVVHVILGVPYVLSSLFYAVVVGGIFLLWYRVEGTLSIHSIVTTRRELFYWAAVLATFALGTAVGDLVGLSLHLGFLAAGLLFAVAICLPLLGWRLGWNATLMFWAAYVLTRPLGASFADWLAKKHSIGSGLGYGDGDVALISLALIAILVGYVASSGRGVQRVQTPLGDAPTITV